MNTTDDLLDDDVAESPPRPRRKGLYVLPNAITLAALFSRTARRYSHAAGVHRSRMP
jgi:hypothetical protein